MTTRVPVLLAGALLLVAGACSGGDDASTASSPASTVASTSGGSTVPPVTTVAEASTLAPGSTASPTTAPLPSTTGATTTAVALTTTAPTPPALCATGSSPASYDPKAGTYASFLTGLDVNARTIGFDVIQFLTGEQAKAAYQQDNPGDPDGPPSDYYIRNVNPKRYQAGVAADVRVWLVRLGTSDNVDLKAGTFAELPTYLAENRPTDGRLSYLPYWLTVAGGTVTTICEQYLP